ncbi:MULTISPECIES: hypothetical protein [unclassified Knoellia]|uniref:hypothetical protein n=1 Tax=Knoellia altitudinis TaxID=3404795 RepID=UPI003611E71A
MSDNPLVVQPGERSWHSGAGLIDSGASYCEAIQSNNWIDMALSSVAVGFDVYATISDPLGSLFAAGIGWIIDHLDPIKTWFDELTGNPEAVSAFAATWQNVSTEVGSVRDDFREDADSRLEGMTGPNVEAYRQHVTKQVQKLDLMSKGARAMSFGFDGCAVLVGFVHGLIRDALAQIAGAICSYVAELVLTLGAATPLVIHQATTRVSALCAEVLPKIKGLKNSVRDLDTLISQLKDILNDIPRFLGDRYSVPNHPNLKWRNVLHDDLPHFPGTSVNDWIREINLKPQYAHILAKDPNLWSKVISDAFQNGTPNNLNDAAKAIHAAVDRQMESRDHAGHR